MTQQVALKTQLGSAAVRQLASALKSAYPEFDQHGFINKANHQLDKLELKDRIKHLIAALATCLPTDFCETAHILEHFAESWPTQSQGQWRSINAWPLIDYVSVYGLNHPQRAFVLLEKLTPLFTAEFAIRPFLEQHFDLTHQQMLRWTGHDNEHVRRLASEGIRPRLPWARHLQGLRRDPSPIWPILEALKTDSSLYVRRSVANNLNDISKDHPELVIALCRQWRQLDNNRIDWLINHGLRTLMKSGRTEVYSLLGFSDKPVINNIQLQLSKTKIELGETLRFTLALATEHDERLMVNYRIGFRSANNRLKWITFKWKEIKTHGNKMTILSNSHNFKLLSTRRYYCGNHYIECLVNGKTVVRSVFKLSI